MKIPRIVSIIVAVALPFALASSSTSLAQIERQPYVFHEWATEPLVAEITKKIENAATEKLVRVQDDKLGKAAKAPTEAIKQLRVDVDAVIAESEDIDTIDQVVELQFWGIGMTARYRDGVIAEVYEAVDERIASIETAVVAWETEVAAENARITAAEEEAARQAAAAAQNRSAYVPTGEGFESRVARIYAGLNITKPSYIIGECLAGNACYPVGSSTMIITTSLSRKSDCYIRGVIAHEARHYQQYLEGLIVIDASSIGNRDWLESDAYAYGGRYGC